MGEDTTLYIGDAVYVDYNNGYHIRLKAGDNVIFLEPQVLWQLIKYANDKLPWLELSMSELIGDDRNQDE